MIAAGALAYPFVLPAYERFVVAIAAPFLRAEQPSVRIEVAENGTLQAWVKGRSGPAQAMIGAPYVPHAILMSLVLLPALILATPAALRRRLWWLAAAAPLLVALHAVAFVLLFRTELALLAAPTHPGYRWLRGLVLTSGQAGAAMLWAAFTWGFWLDQAGSDRVEGRAARRRRARR